MAGSAGGAARLGFFGQLEPALLGPVDGAEERWLELSEEAEAGRSAR